MKKLLLTLACLLSLTVTACNDSHDCDPDWMPPYPGPEGSPIPGFPHGDQGDEDHYRTMSPDEQRAYWQQMSDEDKELLRRQCGC